MSSCNDIVDRGKGQNTCFGSDDNSAALEEKNGCEIADRGAGISYAEGKNKKSSKHVVRCVPTDKLVKLGALTGINLKHTGIPPEAKRKTGKVHTVDSGSTMRKEVLKAAKSRHKSAGRATEGSNNSSERTNSEEEFAEVFSDSTTAAGGIAGDALRRRKPVSLTGSEHSHKLEQRFSLPQIPDNFYRPMVASRLYKVIVIGEIHTGKSALIRRYIHNFYSTNYCATIGVDFRLKLIHYNDDLEIRLQLWDIAGQERFSSMTRAYYKGTMGAIIVFDYSNAKTYQAAIERWKQDLDDKCSLPGNRSVPAILVANKADLKRDKNLPDDLEISRVALERGFVPKWYKTSAKTGENVEEAMNLIIKYIMTLDDWSAGGGVDGQGDVDSGSDLDTSLINLTPPSRTGTFRQRHRHHHGPRTASKKDCCKTQ